LTGTALLVGSLLLACDAPGGVAPDLPPAYAAREPVAGRISVWGHGSLAGRVDFIEALVKSWEAGFRRHQPAVTFENRLHGTASAIGALYTGTGDLALMGREIWPMEVQAFEEVRGYPPTGIDVLTGSYKTRNRGYAIAVFVHRSNPIAGLSLRDLDAVFSADRRRGGNPVRTWGDLGLTGEWAARPVNRYGFALARGFADYIAQAVFAGGRRWHPDLREFADQPGSTGGAADGGQRVLDALAVDPGGLALSGMLYGHPDVRPVAIAAEPGRPFVAPSEASVLDHGYPLTRIITLYVDRAPGRPVAPHVREFVRYILSRDAQEAVRSEGGGYLPMLAPFAERELMKLE
jgi:phosphate transport system substrate-binding protein